MATDKDLDNRPHVTQEQAVCHTNSHGRVADARKHFNSAVEYLTKPISLEDANIQDLTFYLDHAQIVAMTTKDWPNVARIFLARADVEAQTSSPNSYRWYELAVARLAMDDLAGYREVCAEMIDRFEKRAQTDVPVAERILYTCVTVPDSIANVERLDQLAEKSLKGENYGNIRLRGAAAYRAGKYYQAVKHFELLEGQLRAWDWLFLAMAHRRLGNQPVARRCYENAADWKAGESQEWNEVVELRVLKAEVDAVLCEQ